MAECPVVTGASEEEPPFVHSFHLDLRQNPEHRAMLEGVSVALQKTLSRVSQHIAVWRSLDVLWTTDKAAAVEQLQVPYHDCACDLASECCTPVLKIGHARWALSDMCSTGTPTHVIMPVHALSHFQCILR